MYAYDYIKRGLFYAFYCWHFAGPRVWIIHLKKLTLFKGQLQVLPLANATLAEHDINFAEKCVNVIPNLHNTSVYRDSDMGFLQRLSQDTVRLWF